MANYANIAANIAYLNTEFGENLARKWFGDEEIEKLPRYIKGKHKGRFKGAITWNKVLRGGWVRTARATANGEAEGYVETRVDHIFGRKLCELYSDQNGYGAGKCIRDLDAEEYKRLAKEAWIKKVEEELVELKKEKARLEDIKETKDGLTEDQKSIIDSIIQDHVVEIEKLEKELM